MHRARISIALAALAVMLLVGGRLGAADKHPHWSYTGDTGPSAWSKLEPDFAICGLGKAQSPIDLRDEDVTLEDLPAIKFDYKPVAATIVNNGHTIQVNVQPGSSINVNGMTSQLLQFHFHKPSEEKINGKGADMVVHLVHKTDQGTLAVVAVLLRQGAASPALEALWAHLPKKEGPEKALPEPFDPSRLLPAEHGYYAFAGSLTTPPCREGVRWFVLKTPVEVSEAQVAKFGAIYPQNARPTQPRNGRQILASK